MSKNKSKKIMKKEDHKKETTKRESPKSSHKASSKDTMKVQEKKKGTTLVVSKGVSKVPPKGLPKPGHKAIQSSLKASKDKDNTKNLQVPSKNPSLSSVDPKMESKNRNDSKNKNETKIRKETNSGFPSSKKLELKKIQNQPKESLSSQIEKNKSKKGKVQVHPSTGLKKKESKAKDYKNKDSKLLEEDYLAGDADDSLAMEDISEFEELQEEFQEELSESTDDENSLDDSSEDFHPGDVESGSASMALQNGLTKPSETRVGTAESLKEKSKNSTDPHSLHAHLGHLQDEEVVLTDAEGRVYCKIKDCDQYSTTDGHCRFHYLLLWNKIQVRRKILADGKLERYIEELTSRYPDKFLEMIWRDLRSEKDFVNAIAELEIDESGSEGEFEEDETQTYIDEVRGSAGETGFEEEEY